MKLQFLIHDLVIVILILLEKYCWGGVPTRPKFINNLNVNIFLKTERYSYGGLNLDFISNIFANLYDMYYYFRGSYYFLKNNEPVLNPKEISNKAPIIHPY